MSSQFGFKTATGQLFLFLFWEHPFGGLEKRAGQKIFSAVERVLNLWSVWREKSCQMSIKDAQNDFTTKIK